MIPIKQIRCPHCGGSLISERYKIDNYLSVNLVMESKKGRGWLRLSSLYGSYNKESEFAVSEGEIVLLFCPHCNSNLEALRNCERCAAPMAVMKLGCGAMIEVCTRWGCKKHFIEFENLEKELSVFYDTYTHDLKSVIGELGKEESAIEKIRKKIIEKRSSDIPVIVISSGTCGRARGALKVVRAFEEELEKRNLKDRLMLRISGCHGFCEAEPNAVILPKGIFYQHLKPEHVPEIIDAILAGKIAEEHLYTDPESGERFIYKDEIPFYKKQKQLLTRDSMLIDPTSIDDYIAIGGYNALNIVLGKSSGKQIIEIIKKSGLRGRGGAGFPTGFKWSFCRKAKGDTKYIICNADEGDPGAYMDRSLLEGNPHSIIEGMIIGAYAIGAVEGWIYVRHEYPLAIENVTRAIKQAEEYGLLGENILKSGFAFKINVIKGAGAFVCGEETALIFSIESKRGTPRQRPPFPIQKGLFGKPTNINNVETWANVPLIINRGSDWYSRIGTETSKGTKIFSLVGKVNNTGLVEVPMGISLREIIYDVGGGIPNGKKFKAVQIGGPSGGCVPAELLDSIVDYDALGRIGSIMGSGGMIVMDEDTCMVDIARYFLNFLVDESCGKCSVCREGLQRMLEIVIRITEGEGTEEDLEILEELGNIVKDASMCGLGQTAANAVLSTLRHFKDEYLAHIVDKRCPAGVCKPLITFRIDAEKCKGCALCAEACPQSAIAGEPKQSYSIIQEKCIKCGLCRESCKLGAITVH